MPNSNCDRRSFLRTAFFSVGTFFVITSPLKTFANTSSSSTPTLSALDAASLNSEAKLLFYQKRYAESIGLYQRLITSFPHAINYYDGMAKVLKAQQKLLDVAELYREGARLNPTSPLFKQRLALAINTIILGDNVAITALQRTYTNSDLFEVATVLLIDAIALKESDKSLRLSLASILAKVDDYNSNATKLHRPTISISDALRQDIETNTASVSTLWKSMYSFDNTLTFDNVDSSVAAIEQKERRELYTKDERHQRDDMLMQARKKRWKKVLDEHVKAKRVTDVETYGTKILDEDITDTETVGLLRRFYVKHNYIDRLIALNRRLCIKRGTLENKLALAGVLSKHGTSNDFSEVENLLSESKPYLSALPAIYKCSYYLSLARVKSRQGDLSASRTVLMEGMEQLQGSNNVFYTLMEYYALSFMEENPTIGIGILEAIAGKANINDVLKIVSRPSLSRSVTNATTATTNTNLIKYVDTYTEQHSTTVEERLKPLYALAKIQKTTNPAAYAATQIEIETLRLQLN